MRDNTAADRITDKQHMCGCGQVLAGMLRQPGGAELLRQELLRGAGSSSALQALQAAQALSHSGADPLLPRHITCLCHPLCLPLLLAVGSVCPSRHDQLTLDPVSSPGRPTLLTLSTGSPLTSMIPHPLRPPHLPPIAVSTSHLASPALSLPCSILLQCDHTS